MSTITLFCAQRSGLSFQGIVDSFFNLVRGFIPKNKQRVLRIHLNQPVYTLGQEIMASLPFSFYFTRETPDEVRLAVERCERLPLPTTEEQVLCLWRPWSKNEKGPLSPYLFATVAPIDACRMQKGKNQVRVKDIWFEGGGIANKESYSPGIYMGYIAKLDCTEELLKMLRWLTPEQRQQIYELVCPGQVFPK